MSHQEAFYDYAKANQPRFCPLPQQGILYGFIMCGDGNIRISPTGGGLSVPADRLNEVEQDLKQFLAPGCSFVYNKKKARNISTLLS